MASSIRVKARAALIALLVLSSAAALSGCLGDDGASVEEQPIRGSKLTVYSSNPTEGPSAASARAVAAGQRQALADAGRRAGRYRVRLVALSSSKVGEGNWDPGQVSENASHAANDARAIAYLGELNLGASAVSVPVTNDAGMLQVSPGDGLASLTEEPPRSAAGPERYYPSGHRSFLRLVPDDLTTARQMVDRLEALGVERPALIVGSGVYARELAAELAEEARDAGMETVDAKDLTDDPETVVDLVADLAEKQPDAVVLALARDRNTSELLAALGRALPQAHLMAGGGVLVGQPLVAAQGAPQVTLEAVAPAPPEGRFATRTLKRIAREQGSELAQSPALWGYESMRLVLDAIEGAQGGDKPAERAGVVRAALNAGVRRSPIGTYEVLRTGAVDGIPLALYRLEGDRFELTRTLR
jgi:branched-chain amino acid transport system substrate-binding protein